MASKKQNSSPAFTIAELLAAITIVSYTGISSRANIASLQSDLTNASYQLKMYQVEHSAYPDSIGGDGCPTPADTKYCIKSSGSNAYLGYTVNNTISPQTFIIYSSNSTTTYKVTDNATPILSVSGSDWLIVGTQVWGKYNLNVGTRVNGASAQTNNSVLEKYCYNDAELNCTTYGAFYQWDEAMQYVTTNGAQGICPTGSHIPSDNDWKILEVQLGMTQVQADISGGWRGTDQGAKLKTGGSSGLNIPLAGYRNYDGLSFVNLPSFAFLWSSSQSSSTSAWSRGLNSGLATVVREMDSNGYGFSVHCVGN